MTTKTDLVRRQVIEKAVLATTTTTSISGIMRLSKRFFFFLFFWMGYEDLDFTVRRDRVCYILYLSPLLPMCKGHFKQLLFLNHVTTKGRKPLHFSVSNYLLSAFLPKLAQKHKQSPSGQYALIMWLFLFPILKYIFGIFLNAFIILAMSSHLIVLICKRNYPFCNTVQQQQQKSLS